MATRALAISMCGLLLASCYMEGDNARRTTSFRDTSPEAVILAGLGASHPVWLFTGLTLVRLDPATNRPETTPDAVVRFGRSDGDNLRRKTTSFVVVKVKPGRYALANYYIGSNDARRRDTYRIADTTRAYRIAAGRINYIGDFVFDIDPKVTFSEALRRRIYKSAAFRSAGYDEAGAASAVKEYTDVRAPLFAVKSEPAALE